MPEEMRFEDLMRDLEAVVAELEGGNLGLDQAFKRYRKGVELLRTCQETLASMEKKIEILDQDGKAPGPFDPGDASES